VKEDAASSQVSTIAHWDDPVIVLAVGRSGSTLLMRLLNCSRDLVIWGEHNGFLTPLARAFHSLTSSFATECMRNSSRFTETVLQQQPIILEPGQRWSCEWVNAFDKSDVVGVFRNLVLGLLARRLPPDVRWGFKEIRYQGDEIRFLRALFPRAQFIFLLRNPVPVLESIARHFTRGDPKRTAQSILRYLNFLDLIDEQLEEQRKDVIVCHYELFITNLDEQLSRLEQFLGTTFVRGNCEAIMHERATLRPAPEDVAGELATFVDEYKLELDRDKVLLLANRYRAHVAAASKPPALAT